MARRKADRTPAETIALAKQSVCYTRLWWLGFHVVAYAYPIYAGAWRQYFRDWTTGLVLCIALGVMNAVCYVVLQRSSPGFVLPQEEDKRLEDDYGVDGGVFHHDDTSDSLLDVEVAHVDRRHYCAHCHVHQPLRAKHCNDCGRCVEQYDHHCVCAGVCVGRDNHRLFVLYMLTQSLEAIWGMGIASFGMRMNDETDDDNSLEQWLRDSIPFMLLVVFGFLVFLIAFGLLCYHVYLISTNQSSWEHAKRSKITYLKDLPPDVLPFSQGSLMNTWLFLRGRPRNVWTYVAEEHAEASSFPSTFVEESADAASIAGDLSPMEIVLK
ncbi:hypothetical protein H257_11206 [Aphanomyces astaci]|uniref:Palmitoyltransferase n=1 Tax=Aphanomyces astaci TaxID=112090 RepID=W4G5G1_APHAT|nr:hypothetical protein H257_11206 [Aphanomyces astaci]ETV74279.1 hypothetical protein H257_11206 [Aphanomyces astaci]|eukprot:XP_009836386.1 hypothetical protein H257_11206 [Aphanomyces astaci]